MAITRRRFLLIILGNVLAALQRRGIASQSTATTASETLNFTSNPPVYSGPASVKMAIGTSVNFGRYWSSPDGSPLTFSMDASSLGTIDADGVFTPGAAGTGTITIFVDDGKP